MGIKNYSHFNGCAFTSSLALKQRLGPTREFIKERERNRELMEEIAREIEMTTVSPSALFVGSGFRGHLVGIY